MPAYTLSVYGCDEEGCDETIIADTAAEARTKAAVSGWLVDTTDNIKCQEHREYETCLTCGRDMRPWGSSGKTHPGTVAKGGAGFCNVCRERQRRGKPDQVRKQDAKMEAAVARYVSMGTEEFRAVFEGPADVRNELARKAAPEDLWATLGI